MNPSRGLMFIECPAMQLPTMPTNGAIATFMKTKDMLANTGALFEALHVFQIQPPVLPKTPHWGSHIQLMDFHFNRSYLIQRLTQAIASWVFSRKRVQQIFEEACGPTKDLGAASATLYLSAKETFRVEAPQGQFGELLLNSFLQHLFQAVPLLRKQAVRTSDHHERFGADAIHYSNTDGQHLYLGESKCYKSKYKFPAAFECSIESMGKTLSEFTSEIRKFSIGGFIEDDLREVALKVITNQIVGIKLHPISIVIYNETTKLKGGNADEYKDFIKSTIIEQCKKIDPNIYDSLPMGSLDRMTYIIMPVWELDQLLDEFIKAL